MKKLVNIFLAVLITLFSFPVYSFQVSAEAASYDDLKPGEHEVKIKLLQENTDKESTAAQFVEDDATLVIGEANTFLTISIPNNDMMNFKTFKIEGKEAISITDEDEKKGYQFELDQLQPKLKAVVTYEVPGMNLVHENVAMDLVIVNLDQIPRKETPKEEPAEEVVEEEETKDGNQNDKPAYTPAEDQRVVGSLVKEAEADIVYELNYVTDSSATARQLLNPVKVLEKNGKQYVQMSVNDSGAQFFRSLKFNGEEVVWNSVTEKPYTIQYLLEDGLDSKIDLSMVIDTGRMVMPHDGISLSFDKQSSKITKIKDSRQVAELLDESEADLVQTYEFQSDSRATAGQLKNPVKLLKKGPKSYLQIELNESGAKYFKSLKFNDQEVVWNNTEKAPYMIQFPLSDLPSDQANAIDVSMVIDTGRMIMPHDNIKLWLPNLIASAELGTEFEVEENTKYIIDETGNSLKTPANLVNDNIKLTIKSETETVKKYGNKQDLFVAGEVYEFSFENLPSNHDPFELIMAYDAEKFPSDQYDLDIYYFDGKEWLAQGAEDNGKGQVSLIVDHFSTYGVFAKEKEVEEEVVEEPKEDPKEKPNDVVRYTIDYTIKHETKDEASIADQYFLKPGTLIEKDGKTYLQVKVTNWGMIQGVKYGDKNARILSEKEDTGVIELEVDEKLSDLPLAIAIEVPGLYKETHYARLVFDPASKELISEEDNANGDTPGSQTPNNGEGKPGKPAEKPAKDLLKPDKAYKINYTFLQENGKDISAADQYFKKPGILLVKDGKSYLQMTVKHADMVKSLSNKYGDYILVDQKGDTKTLQIRVPNDLSDMKVNMHIVVPDAYLPGGYDSKFTTILTFDLDSKEEVDAGQYRLAASGDKNNENGPYVEGAKGHQTVDNNHKSPSKPNLADAGKDGAKQAKDGQNPKTGDEAQILFFTILLIGSLVVLSLQIKRRLA